MQLTALNVELLYNEARIFPQEVHNVPNHHKYKFDGVRGQVVHFHKGVLHRNMKHLLEMLKHLPPNYSLNGGSSFGGLVKNHDGGTWGNVMQAEQLITMAGALGMASYPMPKEQWYTMPGRLPYVQVNTTNKLSYQAIRMAVPSGNDLGHAVVVINRGGGQHPLPPRLDLFNHSPDGFEWGYNGSGPAQTALAILSDATGDDNLTTCLYQVFKNNYIAKAPKHGFEYDLSTVLNFVDR